MQDFSFFCFLKDCRMETELQNRMLNLNVGFVVLGYYLFVFKTMLNYVA